MRKGPQVRALFGFEEVFARPVFQAMTTKVMKATTAATSHMTV